MKHQHRGSEYKALPVAWEDSDPGCTLPELATGYLPVRPMRRGATLRGAHLGRDLLMFSLWQHSDIFASTSASLQVP